MPISNPNNRSLFDALNRAYEWADGIYKKNVSSSMRRNISDIFDAPVPGNPFAAGKGILQAGDAVSEAVTALPLIAKAIKAGTANANTLKLVNRLKDMFKIGLDPVPVNRFQQEAVDFPVSQGKRGGTFFSFGKDYPGYVHSGIGASEGGPHKVEMELPLKNPLFLKRGNNFIGPEIIHTLAPKKTTVFRRGNRYLDDGSIIPGELKSEIDPRSESKKLLDAIRELAFGRRFQMPGDPPPASAQAFETLAPYLNKRQIEEALQARSGKSALEEALASVLLGRHGYDSAVSLRSMAHERPTERATVAKRLFSNYLDLSGVSNPPRHLSYDPDRFKGLVGERVYNILSELDRQGFFITKGKDRILRKLLARGIEPTNDIINKVRTSGYVNSPATEFTLNLRNKHFAPRLDRIAGETTFRKEWEPTQIFYTDKEKNKEWQKLYNELFPPKPPSGSLEDLKKMMQDMGIL